MADKRDYYEVLGLSKGASASEIKMAYRKAAIKWHPDKWVDGSESEKKKAEEMFKEASEAYGVLSDENKKAKYDQFGFAGVDGAGAGDFSGGFGDLNDILNDLFGGSFGGFGGFGGGFGSNAQRGERVHRGRDIRTRVKLSLEEIATGCTKEISIERNIKCSDCSGRGCKSEADKHTCQQCGGSGHIQQVVNSFLGRSISYATCPTCSGDGKIIKNPCRTCSGHGVTRKRQNLNINIPAGVENNMQLTLEGEGHAAKQNGINGNLLVVIEELPHPNLRRQGANLFYSQTISITDAILGKEISIPCLDGSYKIKLDAGTQSGTVVKLKGKGLPQINSYSRSNGDLYVKILAWVPRKLNKQQKEIFENMRNESEFTPNLSREDKILFDKEKNIY